MARPRKSPRRGLPRVPVLPGLPVRVLIPNMVTVASLCAGLTSANFSLQGKWEQAVTALLIAMVCDGLDGRIARLIGGTSQFGVEMDSLADMVSFGVAPAILMYHWVMHLAKPFGWGICLTYAVCVALRLARFNVHTADDKQTALDKMFFTGVPSPAGALLVALPVMVSFEVPLNVFHMPALIGAYVLAVAFLMISRLRTFSFKRRIRLHHYAVAALLISVPVLASVVISRPWEALIFITTLYLCTLPVGMVTYEVLKRRATLRRTTRATAKAE